MESLFSQRWYRVAGLHPRLRGHVRVSRHIYRDQVWYLLQDTTTGRHHRVDEHTYQFIGRMDGERTVDEIWHSLLGLLRDNTPTQDEAIEVLCQLSDNDLLQCEITPDVAELFRRRFEKQRKRRIAMLNPLSFRVPLFDPDRLLDKLEPLARALFQPWVSVVWLAITLLAVASVLANWDEIRAFAAVNMATPRYLLLMWLCYPIIKAFHELGHALAVKAWGGEVRETGVSLLALVPVPFVDASAASAFPEKYRRVTVGAAGIMVELLLAATGLWLWLHVQNGIVRDIAFIAMVIGGVSTVLFNGNPLLRFDGYFVLSDLLDVPNLGQRSNGYIAYLAQRHLLGVKSAVSPVTAKGEPALLFSYAVLSFFYRWFVSILLVFWAGRYSFWLGALMALLILFSMLVKPLVGIARFVSQSPQLATNRVRSTGVFAGGAVAVIVLLFYVPLPFSTRAQGVVWLPDQARVRAETDGFVVEVLATDRQQVKKGDPLLRLSDPSLIAQQSAQQAKLASLEVEYNEVVGPRPARAQAIADEMEAVRAQLAVTEKRLQSLTVSSADDGTLVMPRATDLPDSFVSKGTVLAHVLRPEEIRVRVAVPQEDVALIGKDTYLAQVRLSDASGATLPARLVQDTPAATGQLPTAALGDRAGGPVVTDPTDKDGLRTLEPVFLFDLQLDGRTLERVGGRVWVRFDHGSRPLVMQWHRRLQQLFLKQFNPQS
jgi:putative peptide zinc metalloprotease protein